MQWMHIQDWSWTNDVHLSGKDLSLCHLHTCQRWKTRIGIDVFCALNGNDCAWSSYTTSTRQGSVLNQLWNQRFPKQICSTYVKYTIQEQNQKLLDHLWSPIQLESVWNQTYLWCWKKLKRKQKLLKLDIGLISKKLIFLICRYIY